MFVQPVELRRRRGGVLPLLVAAALGACGDDLPSEPGDRDPEVVGLWDFVEAMVISSHLVVCSDTGSIRFEEQGSNLVAVGERTGTCKGALGSYPVTTTRLEVTDIQWRDGTISFTVKDGCGCDFGGCGDARYVGEVIGGPQVRIEGSSACSISFDGTWDAMPATAVKSLQVAPDSSEMVVDETIQLRPVMKDAGGARVFARSLDWSTGQGSVVAVSDSGTVLGREPGTATVTVAVDGLTAETQVRVSEIELVFARAGAFHTCALTASGDAYCWGANDHGQSGPAPSLYPCPGVECRRAPGRVTNTTPLTDVTAGFLHSCGLTAEGTGLCWGSNSARQIGQSETMPGSSVPVAVPSTDVFSSVSAGSNHTCALGIDGLASCWGLNNRAQLGSDAGSGSLGPTAVLGGLQFLSVSAGEFHSCGLVADGAAYCWGWNWFQQLGVDSVEGSAEPIAVFGAHQFVSLSAGAEHTCAIDDTGVARCWGRGSEGQLGIEPLEYLAEPAEVAGDLRFTALSSGGRHTCGLTATGAAFCWGAGSLGQLGNGSQSASFSPVAVADGNLRFKQITSGHEHSCGVTLDDTVYCWGSNFNGQLGVTDLPPSPTPRRVAGQR